MFPFLWTLTIYAQTPTQLPKPDPAYQGKVGETFERSTPNYPKPINAPAGSANVLLILLDDVVGDNGASAEGGLEGTFSELASLLGIQLGLKSTLDHIDEIGGPTSEPHVPVAWAWAMDAPFSWTKLIASHFGGTRNPMVIHWPAGITAKGELRDQFHHVIDVVPTILEVCEISEPTEVNGIKEQPIEGISMAYTFENADAPDRRTTQYFEMMTNRAIYHDGWFASAFGPFIPWRAAQGGFDRSWDSDTDAWQLYDLRNDFSQANDLSENHPDKLEAMKELFLRVAEDNQDFPIGAGNWLRLHPADIHTSPYHEWTFNGNTRRMPEFTAPGLGKTSNKVTIDLEVGENATGALYALGGASGGLACYMDKGSLVFEYNLMIIERYIARSESKLAPGEHLIEIETSLARPGAPAEILMTVDGDVVAKMTTKRTVPLAFTASETFDVGIDLGSPVSRDYAERRPFEFDGTINRLSVQVSPKKVTPQK